MAVRGVTTTKGPGWSDPDFQEEAFGWTCLLCAGVRIGDVDEWIAQNPNHAGVSDLVFRRQSAKEAMIADPNDEAGILWHLDVLRSDWEHFKDMQSVVPLAKTGQAAEQQRAAAGFSSARERAAERQPQWDLWQKAADEIFAANKEQSKSAVCKKVGERFGVTGRAVSKRVTGVGK